MNYSITTNTNKDDASSAHSFYSVAFIIFLCPITFLLASPNWNDQQFAFREMNMFKVG